MSISTVLNAITYEGNASTVTPYEIPFPFLDGDHIYLATRATLAADPVLLDSADYTVTRLEDGSGGSVVTDAAVPVDEFLTIWRDVPYTQPLVVQPAGPFPAKSVEYGLDRLAMQIQQLARKLNELLEIDDGNDIVTIPGPGLEIAEDVASWADATARGSKVPTRAGQLGVQLSDSSVWAAGSTTVGDWDAVPTNVALTAVAALTPAADRVAYFTGATTAALLTLTAYARGLLAHGDSATWRTALGLIIGTNVQAWDADLDTLAAATITAAGFNLLDDASASAQRTTLGVGTGDSPVFGNVVSTGTLKAGAVAFSGLPSASVAGVLAFITDGSVAHATNSGTVAAGGGANFVPVYSDGTDWRIL